MKLFILISLFIPSVLLADSSFTSLAGNDHHLFAGVKTVQKGHEPESHLLQISDRLEVKKIKLPPDLLHREVISLIPGAPGKLLIVTQRTVEQGDNPSFHSYDLKTEKWSKEGESDCVSFSRLSVSGKTVSIKCLVSRPDGKEEEVEKKLLLSQMDRVPRQEIQLPQTKLAVKQTQASLSGPPFDWKELKIQQGKKQKIISP